MKAPTLKEMVTHNQVQLLSHLFHMLSSTLTSVIVPHPDEVKVVPCGLPEAAKAELELALIYVIQQISQIAQDKSRWSLDKSDEEAYSIHVSQSAKEIEAQMIAQIFGGAPPGPGPKPKNKSPRKKKGGNEQQ